jgi:hypothetical protein
VSWAANPRFSGGGRGRSLSPERSSRNGEGLARGRVQYGGAYTEDEYETATTTAGETTDYETGTDGEQKKVKGTKGGKANKKNKKKKKKKTRRRRKGKRKGGKRKKRALPSYMQGTTASALSKPEDEEAVEVVKKKPKPPPVVIKFIDLPLPGTARVTQGMLIIETSIDLSSGGDHNDTIVMLQTGDKLRIAHSDEECVIDAIEGKMITLEGPYQGIDDDGAVIEKVIKETEDTRPSWLREFTSGKVEQTWDHQASSKLEHHFGVTITHQALEDLVAQGEDEQKADKPLLVRGSGGESGKRKW